MLEIAALGAGRMGRGIALVFAAAGIEVALIDFKQRPVGDAAELLRTAETDIRRNLSFLSETGLLGADAHDRIIKRIHFLPIGEAGTVLATAKLVFEGVPEIATAKQDAFQRLTECVGDDTIIASTTSTMAVDDLARHVAGPRRFLNAHWLNPAYLIPLVEVSPGAETDPAVTAANCSRACARSAKCR